MFVSIDEPYDCALREPHDFKNFKLCAAHPRTARPVIAETLTRIGGALGDSHAWIPIDWLRRQPEVAGDEHWQRGLLGMVAYAAGKGWVDASRGWVRAHVEWQEALS